MLDLSGETFCFCQKYCRTFLFNEVDGLKVSFSSISCSEIFSSIFSSLLLMLFCQNFSLIFLYLSTCILGWLFCQNLSLILLYLCTCNMGWLSNSDVETLRSRLARSMNVIPLPKKFRALSDFLASRF